MTLRTTVLPRHVAIIMDGNRRWARARNLPAVMGHRKVVEGRVEELIDHAGRLGIAYLTFWAFSTENWERPEPEVGGIMNLFRLALNKYAERMIKKGARLRVIGDMSKFENDIREGVERFVEQSKDNDKITVTFALNYGGRDEILRAMRSMYDEEILRISGGANATRNAQDDKDVVKNLVSLSINDFKMKFSGYLDTAGMPDPDLIIRTGGEQRLSGFMLWQAEYSELYFTNVLMPDFGAGELDAALMEYGQRERRRGR